MLIGASDRGLGLAVVIDHGKRGLTLAALLELWAGYVSPPTTTWPTRGQAMRGKSRSGPGGWG